MIDINKLTYPITLATLENEAPEAYQELIRKHAGRRSLLLVWLNGKSTSPIGRNHADKEFDKEDEKQSALKIKDFIEFESQNVKRTNCVIHLMTEQQRHDFFNEREAMRERVKKKVEEERKISAKSDFKRVCEVLGLETVAELLELEAANDPFYKEKAE